MLSLYSSINPSFMKQTLFKGFSFFFLGVVLLLLAIFFSQQKIWAIPIILAGFALIGTGIIPYKKISRIKNRPHQIHVEKKNLTFFERGNPLFRLDISEIQSIEFLNLKEIYGISVQLKKNSLPFLTLLASSRQFANFTIEAKSKAPHCDLFFPFFSKQSFEQLSFFLILVRPE